MAACSTWSSGRLRVKDEQRAREKETRAGRKDRRADRESVLAQDAGIRKAEATVVVAAEQASDELEVENECDAMSFQSCRQRIRKDESRIDEARISFEKFH
ncbi:hypothetical protein BpHYR1_020933 [Brachionus plicatilis]|uniref:Uncharacterized protein n=1 Tax=Brachionus plicatilis TaxID=10195 RepID=A0A3M7RQT6_BRAPC|nr:hypothetical protein BpHYR1_020933 [Brachionus plicatilis]